MVGIELFRRDKNTLAFNAGETIFAEGDAGDRMYVIVEGEVNLMVHGLLLESLGPGGVFGEMALLGHEPRTATVSAYTNCKLAPIDARRFLFLVQETPYFALQMMRVMSDRLRRMDLRI